MLRHRAESDVAVAADVPVAEDIDAVAVDAAGDLALLRGAVDHLRSVSGPLVHDRTVHFSGLFCVAFEAGPGAFPGQIVVIFFCDGSRGGRKDGKYCESNGRAPENAVDIIPTSFD